MESCGGVRETVENNIAGMVKDVERHELVRSRWKRAIRKVLLGKRATILFKSARTDNDAFSLMRSKMVIGK